MGRFTVYCAKKYCCMWLSGAGVMQALLLTLAVQAHCAMKMKGKSGGRRCCGYVSHVVAEVLAASKKKSIKT